MEQSSAQDRGPQLLFAGIVIGVYTSALAVANLLPYLERPRAVAVGLTLDMVAVVPLAFYLLIVRRRGLPLVTLAPVLVLSVVAAAQILPPNHQEPLRILESLAAPLELALVSWIVWRAARALRTARRDATADPLEQLGRAAFELLRHKRAAAILASEIAMFYYAIGSWWARPHAPSGTSTFTYHRRSGHAGIAIAFLLVILVEGVAVHFLLSIWSALAAWVFTIGTAYGALWLIADYRAAVLRPILVNDESVYIRAGLRWCLRVPWAQIAEVDGKKPDFGKESLNITFLGTPTHWVILTQPMLAQGPYGLRRRVRAIGIQPDAVGDFDRVLSARPV